MSSSSSARANRAGPPDRRKVTKRVVNACQRCKSRKIKCDGQMPVCGKCSAQDAECLYGERKWRGKGRTQAHMKDLEERLEQMEHSLRHSGRSQDSDDVMQTVEEHPPEPLQEVTEQLESSNGTPQGSQSTGRTDPRYVTVPDYIRDNMNVLEKSGSIPTTQAWKAQKQFVEMMPKQHALVLVYSYLDDVNAVEFPIFHPPSIMFRFQHSFPVDGRKCDPAWWACLNTILAIALQSKSISNARDFSSVSKYAWGFFKNAWAVYPEITNSEPTVLSVLALLCMARFLEGTTDLRTMTMVISCTVRMVQILGLYQEPSDQIRELERDQRRRIFWCTYLMDKRASIEVGLPPLLDQDYQVAIPTDTQPNHPGCVTLENGNVVNILRLRVSLAMIETRLSKCLLNPSSKMEELKQIFRDLEEWKNQLAPEIHPESDMRLADGQDKYPILIIHLAYYHCVSEAYRAIARGSDFADHEAASIAVHQTASAARLALSLIRWLDFGLPFLSIWKAIRYFLAASHTLLTGVIAQPDSHHSHLDITCVVAFNATLKDLQDKEGLDLKAVLSDNQMHQTVMQSVVNGRHASGVLGKLPGVEDNLLFVQAKLANLPRLEESGYPGMDSVLQQVGGTAPIFCSMFAPEFLRPGVYGFGRTTTS